MDYFRQKTLPFRKQATAVSQFRSIKDRIFQVEKKIFFHTPTIASPNMSPSPEPQSRKPNPNEKISLLEKVLSKDHRITKDKIQIIKLPKLPYGQHAPYNSEDLFVTNHFIPTEDSERTRELDEAVKRFRLFEKNFKKSQRSNIDIIEAFEKKKPYLSFRTGAGYLVCKKNQPVIQQYEQDRDIYTTHSRNSIQTFREFEEKDGPKSQRVSRSSVKAAIKRLYPTPEPTKSRLLSYLLPKYSALFDSPAK
jgi:hypothetical protein